MKAKSKPKTKSVLNTIFYILGLLVWASAAIIVSQIIVGIILVKILGMAKFEQPLWTTIYFALSYLIAIVLIILPSIKTIHRTKLGLRGTPTWTDIGLAPAGFVIYFILAAGLTALFSVFPWFNPEEAQDVGFNLLLNNSDRIIAFVALVLIAPIAEEIIFRGWLYGKIREKLSEKLSQKITIVISIFLVSLLFGIIHMQWNVGVNVFAMSIILCGMREITGTIYSGILMHMLKNYIAFYLLYILGI